MKVGAHTYQPQIANTGARVGIFSVDIILQQAAASSYSTSPYDKAGLCNIQA